MDPSKGSGQGHARNSNQTRPGGPGTYPHSSAVSSRMRSPKPPGRSDPGSGATIATSAGEGCSTSTRTRWSSASTTTRRESRLGSKPPWRTAFEMTSLRARQTSSTRSCSVGEIELDNVERAIRAARASAGKRTSLRRISISSLWSRWEKYPPLEMMPSNAHSDRWVPRVSHRPGFGMQRAVGRRGNRR